MTNREVSIDLKARDGMSQVLDHVASRFGIVAREGAAMGVAFAGVNLAVGAMQQAMQGAIQYVQDGISANRQMELSYARLAASAQGFNMSQDAIKQNLQSFSVMFVQDMNTSIQGFQRFIQEGYNAKEAMKLLYESGRLGVDRNTDLATSEEAVNTALQVFSLNASQSGHVAEKLNQILGTSLDMTMQDLVTIMGAQLRRHAPPDSRSTISATSSTRSVSMETRHGRSSANSRPFSTSIPTA